MLLIVTTNKFVASIRVIRANLCIRVMLLCLFKFSSSAGHGLSDVASDRPRIYFGALSFGR